MDGTVYWPTWWALWGAGLLPALYFLVTFRPSRLAAAASVNTGGWVAVIALLYAWAGYSTATRHTVAPSLVDGLIGLAFSAAVAGLLWVRAVWWWRYRSQVERTS